MYLHPYEDNVNYTNNWVIFQELHKNTWEECIFTTQKPTHIYTHQSPKGNDLKDTLQGEEGSKHYVEVG